MPTRSSRGCVRLFLPEDELGWRFSRSGGPGGQHVNTSDTRVSLSLDLAATSMLTDDQRARALQRLRTRLVDGVLTVTVSDHRSQARNRDLARQRMTELISEAVAPGPRTRRATKPSRGARERRLDGKRRRSDLKRSRSRRFDD
ncbi:alternative ribosome rescue aminoacyl-tRNA hydrolase ArfB [Nocardiopsis sediminis]|uniref:Alternative ribosome rescue aminoacyl-tRNA hydrolase ArfB n=1 Tax=Nocardiopsis sediminis TaxID=1778267 RepID=A0ABV8FQV8_9ACTN